MIVQILSHISLEEIWNPRIDLRETNQKPKWDLLTMVVVIIRCRNEIVLDLNRGQILIMPARLVVSVGGSVYVINSNQGVGARQ